MFNFRLDQITAGMPGIVTTKDWMYTTTGDMKKAFWSRKWFIVTDAQMPIENFKSTEKWTLIGVDTNNEIVMLIPGCMVAGFVSCKTPPVNVGNIEVIENRWINPATKADEEAMKALQ